MSQKTGIFISGTDTGVGKTVVSSLLLAALKAHGETVGYFKPVQTGVDLDTETVKSFCNLTSSEFSSPAYQLALPAAPSRAAQVEGVQIQLDQIQKHWETLEERTWVVEGAGGLLVPLNGRQTIRELVSLLNMKLLLVSSTRLGTINHTLLSLEAASAAHISLAGIVLVGDEDPELGSILKDLTDVPILTRIPQFSSLSPALIQDLGPRYFTPQVLRSLNVISP